MKSWVWIQSYSEGLYPPYVSTYDLAPFRRSRHASLVDARRQAGDPRRGREHHRLGVVRGASALAAVFFASPDRKGERPLTHLAAFSGVLQADGYAGFNGLYEARRPGGALIEAACWAHTRRKFFDVHARTGSAVAFEALERIGAIFDVERSVSGKPPDERLRQRQARSQPLAAALKAWAETILPQLSGGSDLAKAFR